MSQFFDVAKYPAPTSDLVALMTLEHQTHMTNLLTRVGWEARMALHYQAGVNKATGEAPGYMGASANRRIDSAVEEMLEYMLFLHEPLIKDRIEGAVTKITDFGAFVELEEGIEGLIYVSELADHRVEKPSDVVKVGDKVRAEILSIETRERRIGLSIKQLGRSEERANYEAYVGERSKKASMGDLFGDKLKAAIKGEKKGE